MTIAREQLSYLLQNADNDRLMELTQKLIEQNSVCVLSNPAQQTLMVPVLDPVTNTRFYSGEILVTQALIEINGVKGWSMVMDSDTELALAVAVCDGAFDADISRAEITALAEEGKQKISSILKDEAEKTASTRVSFDMMSNMSGNM